MGTLRGLLIFCLYFRLVETLDSAQAQPLTRKESPKSSSELLQLDLSLGFCNNVNLREITIPQLQKAQEKGELSAADLIRCYRNRILRMNPYLNAVIELDPDAPSVGGDLDSERRIGRVRSPMHGIPILVKDNIGTRSRMESTAGSWALVGLRPKKDSDVVRRLRKAGAIILGTANLSEFAGFRTANPAAFGWSGRGHQTHNAYVLSASPLSSSSGSAVAVAANLIPVALGTETGFSIVNPSMVASVVGLKPTVGRVSTSGVIPVSRTLDVVGPIARTVTDAAIVFGIISKNGFQNPCFNPTTSFLGCKQLKWRVGVLRNPFWKKDAINSQIPALENCLTNLRKAGLEVIDPVLGEDAVLKMVTVEGYDVTTLHELKDGLNSYLRTNVSGNRVVMGNQEYEIRSLKDIIQFNKRFPPQEGYGQDRLMAAQATDGLQNTTYIAGRKQLVNSARGYLRSVFKKSTLDAIVIPSSQSTFLPAHVSTMAGYPSITVPVGFGEDNLPFGITFIGIPNSEESLLHISYLLERKLRARQTSRFLS